MAPIEHSAVGAGRAIGQLMRGNSGGRAVRRRRPLGGGVFIHAEDQARIGLLMLRCGSWGDRQVVSDEWVRQSTIPCACNPQYGLLWWLNTGRQRYPGTSAESFLRWRRRQRHLGRPGARSGHHDALEPAIRPPMPEAMLIIEVEGSPAGQDDLLDRLKAISRSTARDPRVRPRQQIGSDRKGREASIGAIGSSAPVYLHGRHHPDEPPAGRALTGSPEYGRGVPLRRRRLPRRRRQPATRSSCSTPTIPTASAEAQNVGADVLKLCVEVAAPSRRARRRVPKRDLMPCGCGALDLEQQRRIKSAFDPDWLL